jgi:hypothetical protein
VIPEIDIWRAANLMLKRYGDKALEESAARGDDLAAQDDYSGEAVWRRITDAVRQLANQTPAGPLLLYQKGSPTVTPQYHAEIRQSRRRGLCDRAAVPGYGAPAWKSFSMRAFPFLSTNPWIVAFR